MAENYISQSYTWVTGNTITAARLNANISALISGLSDGTKAININKLLIGAQAVFTLSSTDINVTNLNTVSMKNDLTIYKPSNDGNPKIVLGSSATEGLFITTEYGSGTQTLQKATFNTKTASATADYGQFVFSVDEVEVINFKDALVTITGGLNLSSDFAINTNKFNVTASSGNTLIAGTLGVTGTISGNLTGNVTGNCSGSAGSCTGLSATATALATPRAINGVNFDGTAAITVTADANTLTGTTLKSTIVSSSLTSVGTLTNLTVTNKITGSISGNCDGTAGSVAASALTGNTLASGITASSLTSVGTLTSLNVGNVVSTGTLRGYIFNESSDSNYDLKMKCVNIGAWNMDSNQSGPTVTIFSGANYCNRILMAQIFIRKDDGLALIELNGAGTLNGYFSISYSAPDTIVSMGRAASGSDFDNTSYDDTGISRGYICIWYH